MVAWDDHMTWAERDEAIDFDGVAGYPRWDGSLAEEGSAVLGREPSRSAPSSASDDPELAAISGLREALAEIRDVLDQLGAIA
jgi:hypothetical protein